MLARTILPIMLLALSACATSPYDYWGQQIDALPDNEAFNCREGLQDASQRWKVKVFCPPGIPVP